MLIIQIKPHTRYKHIIVATCLFIPRFLFKFISYYKLSTCVLRYLCLNHRFGFLGTYYHVRQSSRETHVIFRTNGADCTYIPVTSGRHQRIVGFIFESYTWRMYEPKVQKLCKISIFEHDAIDQFANMVVERKHKRPVCKR